MNQQLKELKLDNVSTFERLLATEKSSFWKHRGEKRTLELFQLAAAQVPAYHDLLKKNGVDYHKVKTIEDFKAVVPVIDKDNYIKAYPIEERCWKGDISRNNLIAISSGTSGEPVFWPRAAEQDLEAMITHELIYKHLFNVDQLETLIIIGFPMGFYVSGVATLLPTWLFSMRQYPVTVISAGNNKNEILRVIKSLSHKYQQTLLVGHPFFIKDVVETGVDEQVKWKSLNIKMLYCSEGFSELWRAYVTRQVGSSTDISGAMNTYGSSELLLIGHETPLTVLARKAFEKKQSTSQAIFGMSHPPQFFQYNPVLRYIEVATNGNLLFTVNSGVPLIRFDLHDHGQIIEYDQFTSLLNKYVPTWPADYRRTGKARPWRLPVVVLYGRSDQTVIFYAANIYPDHIHFALEQRDFLDKITGKFTLTKSHQKNHDQSLVVNIELQANVKGVAKLQAQLKRAIFQTLLKVNKEYFDTVQHHPNKDLSPQIKLWPYQHEKYFKVGLKPKYIIKSGK